MDNTFDAVLDRIRELVAAAGARDEKLGAVCALLKEKIGHYDWVGFYLVDETNRRALVLGPFAGKPTDHTWIPFGTGICGQAAERRATFIVQDVLRETNYLSCSPDVKSEIVVPIFKDGDIAGELDIDSHVVAPFTDADREFLEKVCGLVAPLI